VPPTFGIIVLIGWLLKFLIVAIPLSILIGAIAFLVFRFYSLKRPENKQRINLLVASGVIVFAFWIFVCVGGQLVFPVMEFFDKTSPAKVDFLVGTWVPTDAALQSMAESNYGFSAHRITFNPDGSLSIANVPSAWIKPQTDSTLDFYSGNGKWEIVDDTKGKKIQIYLDSIDSPIMMDWLNPRSEFDMNLIYFRLSGADNFASFEKCSSPFLRMKDERFTPLWDALSKVDRDTLGFTPISPDARVEYEGTIGETDVMLHVYGDTSRTVTFRKLGDSYQWIHEQEIHEGKDKWTDYDGAVWVESITIEYQTEDINGIPLNTIWIDYTERDSRTSSQDGLSLKDVQPIIEEWKIWKQSQPPLSISLCP
jgi:hypothetical protein